jgi:hypothetical protein
MTTIKRNTKKYNEYILTGKWTAGKILTLHSALKMYAPHSAVAQDVLNELDTAIRETNPHDILYIGVCIDGPTDNPLPDQFLGCESWPVGNGRKG